MQICLCASAHTVKPYNFCRRVETLAIKTLRYIFWTVVRVKFDVAIRNAISFRNRDLLILFFDFWQPKQQGSQPATLGHSSHICPEIAHLTTFKYLQTNNTNRMACRFLVKFEIIFKSLHKNPTYVDGM